MGGYQGRVPDFRCLGNRWRRASRDLVKDTYARYRAVLPICLLVTHEAFSSVVDGIKRAAYREQDADDCGEQHASFRQAGAW